MIQKSIPEFWIMKTEYAFSSPWKQFLINNENKTKENKQLKEAVIML